MNNAPIAHYTIYPVLELKTTNSIKRVRYGTVTKYCKQGCCRTCFKYVPSTMCQIVKITNN